MALIERTLTINIRKEIHKVPAYRRAKKAITAVRKFLMQHMKATEENVKIGKYLNLKIWEHGIKNPITKITVIAKKDDKGIVTAELPNIPVKKQKPQKAKPKSSEARLGPVDASRLGAGKAAKTAEKTVPTAASAITPTAPADTKAVVVAKESTTAKKA